MGEPMGEQPPACRRTIAEKLDHLFQEIHPAGRGPFSYHEVAHAIRRQAEAGGPTVSHGTLQQIRTGAKTNPTVNTLEVIAAFFGVPAAYFLDDTVAELVDARVRELKADAQEVGRSRAAGGAGGSDDGVADELAGVLADSNIRAVAFRLAGLSPKALKALRAIVDQVRAVEGLPAVGRVGRVGRRRSS
ncbi:helix-turn-helix transcriptional regulator [Kitasatospora sp. MAA4]|uniref:helix-turn-helix domain-containing protein n=1 Tax=Kitasatospora sp. MAA4 TaxID=3035093 RepID=UPI00247329B4|nr:helix-turn-helix transcriptional regulator [Kitasatospora sp. MAA4]